LTTRLTFTQAGLRRAIKAARKEGLHIRGIRPDGTLIVAEDRDCHEETGDRCQRPLEAESEIVL
jgi:hypothetical protein